MAGSADSAASGSYARARHASADALLGMKRAKSALMAGPFWLVEESTASRLRRESDKSELISLRLYRVDGGRVAEHACKSYESGSLVSSTGWATRAQVILDMLEKSGCKLEPVICSHRTTSARWLTQLLSDAGFCFVLEVSPDAKVVFRGPRRSPRSSTPRRRLRRAEWQAVSIGTPDSAVEYGAVEIGDVEFAAIGHLHCFGISTGRIKGYQRGLMVGISNLSQTVVPLSQRAAMLGWLRWIRPVLRREGRDNGGGAKSNKECGQLLLGLDVRHNIEVARKLDKRTAVDPKGELFGCAPAHRLLCRGRDRLNVVELFAGAGGMGLGFLLANREAGADYAIRFSGELHPIYARSLRESHSFLSQNALVRPGAVPEDTEAVDLTDPKTFALVKERAGEVDVLIGGPPCQGMSNANRNSWSGANPNNRLIDTFIDYAELLAPRVLLLENVQGILWTPKEGGQVSVAAHVVERLAALGYILFPKILDAAWYGVPQHRNRFFLLALQSELGYTHEHFGRWGPFPAPTHGPGSPREFTTVKDAIGDLPPVPNGFHQEEIEYHGVKTNDFLRYLREGAPQGVIWDHVTSRHADYVIARYRKIPEGGNWQDIADLMTNYTDVRRTHSNIYRRLRWSEPSITIGHYRKSMIVHPSQHRGLTLREAMRLQGFPDYVRFAGNENGGRDGLIHKQQQLANAVSPPVTCAVARFLLEL